MTNFTQTTISRSVNTIGIGMHNGCSTSLVLEPSESDKGIVFYRSDKQYQSVKFSFENICNTKLATTICNSHIEISTIEHLMSAIYSYGIDNINIYVSGSEIPILDGSGAEFCKLLDEAGIKKLDQPKKTFKITKEVIVESNGSFAKISPSNSYELNYEINFKHPSIGSQQYSIDFSKELYIDKISKARTFGFIKDIEYMQSQGLAKGASMSNAIALDDNKILNTGNLRYSNEFVRHKILDAIGDLSVLGMSILGKYESYAGSHHLNFLLSQKILEEKAYEIL